MLFLTLGRNPGTTRVVGLLFSAQDKLTHKGCYVCCSQVTRKHPPRVFGLAFGPTTTHEGCHHLVNNNTRSVVVTVEVLRLHLCFAYDCDVNCFGSQAHQGVFVLLQYSPYRGCLVRIFSAHQGRLFQLIFVP